MYRYDEIETIVQIFRRISVFRGHFPRSTRHAGDHILEIEALIMVLLIVL